MTAWRSPVLFQSVFVSAAAVSIRLAVSYRALDMGADAAFLGMLVSAFALPALLGALSAGRLADRIGGSWLTLAGIVANTAGTATVIFVPSLPLLLVACVLIGLGQLLTAVGQQTYVAHASSRGGSDSAFGTLSAAVSLGQVIGPPAVMYVSAIGQAEGEAPNTELGLLLCLAFGFLAAPTTWFMHRSDRNGRQQRRHRGTGTHPPGNFYRSPELWRSIAVSGIVQASVDLVYAFIPLWATGKNLDTTTVGWLLALRATVSVASRIGLQRIISRFGRPFVLNACILLAVAALFVLPWVGEYGAIGVMIALGIGLGIPQPVTMAWATSITPRTHHGAVLGLRMTANRLAQISMPAGVGLLAAPFGVFGIFWMNAALLAGAAVLVAGSANASGQNESAD